MDDFFFEAAEKIGEDKDLLRERLTSGKGILYATYRAYFIRGKMDFTNKRLIGSSGFYLQWENDGKSSTGSVYLEREKK